MTSLQEDARANLVVITGSFNVYEIDGKAYYWDDIGKVWIRTPDKDHLVGKSTLISQTTGIIDDISKIR